MLEIIAFIGGIVILATGRVPHVLFGDDDTYSISKDGARVVGFLLLAPLPLALGLILLFPPGSTRLVIGAAYYILIIAAGILYRSSRFKRSVSRDGMLIGTTIPAEKAHIEETIAKKTYRSLLPMMLCITGLPALILGPLAIFRTRQAIKLSNEHQIGQGHRTWAYIICVWSGVGTLCGLATLILLPILIFSRAPLPGVPIETPAFSQPTDAIATRRHRVAFVSDRDGNLEIYSIYSDGTELTRLTNSPEDESFAGWSPDGTRIAFYRAISGDNLYVMNLDGTGLTALPGHAASEFTTQAPTWSPDGLHLAFTSADEDGPTVVTIDIDGSNLMTLDWGQLPVWSPDGRQIAYLSHNQTPFLMNVDGTNQRQLADLPYPMTYRPNWSPDGTQLLLMDVQSLDSPATLYTVNADGSGLKMVTDQAYHGYGAAEWSPDGQWITFVSISGDTSEIYRIRPDGTELTQLTHNSMEEFSPLWALDGSLLAFTGENDLYVMLPDGSDLRQLTDHPAVDRAPRWQP